MASEAASRTTVTSHMESGTQIWLALAQEMVISGQTNEWPNSGRQRWQPHQEDRSEAVKDLN
jgi:hypothetical protein